MAYELLADVVLVLHAGFVAFVVGGFVLSIAGLLLGWRWVGNRWFRGLHLAAIGLVVVQAWVGVLCPLTTIENWLRERAGQPGYAGSFIQHWLHRLLFYDAEPWLFTVVYTLFGLLVGLTWWLTGRRGRLESAGRTERP